MGMVTRLKILGQSSLESWSY